MEYNYITLIPLYITILIIMCTTSSYPAHQGSPVHRSLFCNAPKDKPHISSYPYVSGDTFRSYANFIIEGDQDSFDTDSLHKGNIIFVQTDYLEHFFRDIHPLIRTPYILITHNSDDPAPGPYYEYLNDERIIAWFGQNPSISHHPKFIPIPIGIANKSFDYGNTTLLDSTLHSGLYTQARDQKFLLYMNFTITTNAVERQKAYNAFINTRFCTYAPRLPYERYIKDLTMFQYVVSPEGNGLDCYRTWEALLLGCIPIVKHSALDPLFEDLPVLLINDWDEISEEFLIIKCKEIRRKTHQYEKLSMDHWLNQIKNIQIKHSRINGD